MPTLQTFQVFKTGTHIAMNGNAYTYTRSDIRQIADSFNLEEASAPLVLGHPKDDQPVYGQVRSLITDKEANHLFAHAEVSDVLTELVRCGAYRHVSIKLINRISPASPAPGGMHLVHVGFLGAHPPAVKGLEPLKFAQAGQGAKEVFEFSELAVGAPLWGAGLASAAPHPSCFAAPAGWQVDPERFWLHLKILQRQRQTPGMTYVQALREISSTVNNH